MQYHHAISDITHHATPFPPCPFTAMSYFIAIPSSHFHVHVPPGRVGSYVLHDTIMSYRSHVLISLLQGGLVDHGVHAFLVPIRDAQGALMPGVEIRDCGYKVRLVGWSGGWYGHAQRLVRVSARASHPLCRHMESSLHWACTTKPVKDTKNCQRTFVTLSHIVGASRWRTTLYTGCPAGVTLLMLLI